MQSSWHKNLCMLLFAAMTVSCFFVIVRLRTNPSVEEHPGSGKLEITVKDRYEKTYLMGAGFRLYDWDGNPVVDGYTDGFGKLIFPDLPYGSYTCQAFKAPKGFEPGEMVYPISLTEDNASTTQLIQSLRRPGTIRARAQDPDGSPLAGAAFLLEFSIDKGSHWAPVFPRNADTANLTRGGCTSPGLEQGRLITDSSGVVTFSGLRADGLILYRLSEQTAKAGAATLYAGTLPVESENIYANDAEVFNNKAFVYTLSVNAADGPLFRLPAAGGCGCSYLSLAMLLSAAPLLISNTERRKQHEKNLCSAACPRDGMQLLDRGLRRSGGRGHD